MPKMISNLNDLIYYLIMCTIWFRGLFYCKVITLLNTNMYENVYRLHILNVDFRNCLPVKFIQGFLDI